MEVELNDLCLHRPHYNLSVGWKLRRGLQPAHRWPLQRTFFPGGGAGR
jgi:hypothetical protein